VIVSDINQIAAEFRADLLRGEQKAAARMVRAYVVATRRLSRDLQRLIGQIERAEAKGERPGISWLFQQERLANLKREAEAELAVFARQAAQETAERQAAAVGVASEQARELTVAALGPGPVSAVASVEVSFVRLPVGAIEELVGVLGDGSPLRRLFDELPAMVSGRLEQALLAGVAAGLSPREIARSAQDGVNLGLNRALLIARTEVLRAHREATRTTYQANADVVAGWVWHANLDRRTCPACWAMHGSFHGLDERLDGHPGCRCAMVPRTRSWAELGFLGIPETRPEVEVGSEVFARQPEEAKREVLGRAGYLAFRRGEVKLADFVARRENPEWGSMRYARSLKAIGEGRGGETAGAVAVPGPPS
jgi:SPP1 gp7 family putative phage head morphogenesis protein